MTTLIDIIMNKIEAIMEEAEIQLYDNGDSGASDMSNLRAILEKHLHTEPAKNEVEIKRLEDSMGICPLCDEYQFPKQKYCSDCGAKIKRIDESSEQVGGMLQPGEYMRDNEGNITTYEDEQKEKKIEKPESECNCKGGRHCEVCRKADSVGAGIEKKIELEEMTITLGTPERNEVKPLWQCIIENIKKIADRINKQ